MNSEATSIHFEDVTVAYKDNVALDSFSLTIEGGEIMALIGPSGSGKTTALRSVAGFVRPTSGRILLGTRDITDEPPRNRHISMVVQQYALFPHMRVFDNVAFGMRAQHMKKEEIEPRVMESLRLVGMTNYVKRYPAEMSGGQQQRVAIARAIAVRPRVLLLDEPLSALDAQLRSGMLAEIARLHRELPSLTILYVTHDQSEALTLADRITVMHNSRLVDVGKAHSLYQRPPSRFTAEFLGNANLIPVTVESVDRGAQQASVKIADTSCQCAAPEAVGESRKHVLCVRPHALRLEPDASCANKISAKLTSALWLGSMFRLFLDIDGCEVRVDSTTVRTPPSPGDQISLYFATSDASLIEVAQE